MDDPILEKRLKNMFESRAGELPDESVRDVIPAIFPIANAVMLPNTQIAATAATAFFIKPFFI